MAISHKHDVLYRPDAELRNNIILSSGNGINSHSHQAAVPSNLLISGCGCRATPTSSPVAGLLLLVALLWSCRRR